MEHFSIKILNSIIHTPLRVVLECWLSWWDILLPPFSPCITSLLLMYLNFHSLPSQHQFCAFLPPLSLFLPTASPHTVCFFCTQSWQSSLPTLAEYHSYSLTGLFLGCCLAADQTFNSCLPFCQPACLPACLSACLPVCLYGCQSEDLAACLSAGGVVHVWFSARLSLQATKILTGPTCLESCQALHFMS